MQQDESFRWFPYEVHDGPHNMAADEVLLEAAAESGIASLRFYGWSPPTLSLGYFQPAHVRRENPLWARLPFVRRPSGGNTLVHHHELTYSLALPRGFDPRWLRRMHERVLLPALRRLEVNELRIAEKTNFLGDVLCFQQQTPGDLLCHGRKIGGSAQRKQRQALLQHGSILLGRSEYAPELLGIRELNGHDLDVGDLQQALLRDFRDETGWEMRASAWSAEEQARIAELIKEKYAAPGWNEKR